MKSTRYLKYCDKFSSLPARGGWIEIGMFCPLSFEPLRPSPHGEGGLKSISVCADGISHESLPARGGWIEIWSLTCGTSPPTSLPARGGWIEITVIDFDRGRILVPPRTGRVD